jgi:GNAT superfamily N-acetyltransferase
MKVNFNIEKFNDYIDEVIPLLTKHWEEVALNKDVIELSPDFEKYQVLEDIDVLHSVIGRDGAGNITCYFISFVQPHVHYSETVFAMNDILYVKPELRHTGLALELFKYAETDLKSKGVDVITLHAKRDHQFKNLCEAFGASEAEVTFSKYIG